MIQMTGSYQGLFIVSFWLFWAVVTDMAAIYALMRSRGFRRLSWAFLSLAMIFLSFMCMRRVVAIIPLGMAYALWCAFGIFGTVLIGSQVFHQRISRQEYLGIGLLTLGIICMSLA